jgi:hypothetical protein
MADWRKTAAMAALAAAMAFTPLIACNRDSTPDVDDDLLADLTAELGKRECVRRLDSLAFVMEGILFESDVDITQRDSVLSLVPSPLPVCPVSGDTYTVEDEGMVLVFTCPSGHGSVEVQ